MTRADDPHDEGNDLWARLAEGFVDIHYGSARGRIRTRVIDHHLRAHLSAPPVEIVDVGGGAGHQSLPLAAAGHRVTIVDPSPGMLERARRRVAESGDDVADRVDLVEAAGEEVATALGGRRFGAVLCHGVIPYLDEPGELLDALAELAQPGGLVSILAKNVHAMAVRPALDDDWAAARRAFDATREVNALGVDTRGDDVDELAAALADRDVDTLAWYGVRLFTEAWEPEVAATDGHEGTGAGAGPEPADDVLAVELEASRRDPYRQLSRLFHLVGRRR